MRDSEADGVTWSLTWLFSPEHSKKFFDYIRNTGLCVVVIVASFYMQRIAYGLPLYSIVNSPSYEELCSFTLGGETEFLGRLIVEHRDLYLEGFKTGRVFSAEAIKELGPARRVVGTIEYRRQKQEKYELPSHLASIGLFWLAILLLLANVTVLIRNLVRDLSPLSERPFSLRIAGFLERALFVSFAIGLTLSIAFGLHTERGSTFEVTPINEEFIVGYTEFLGPNEYDEMEDYYERCGRPWFVRIPL